MTLDVSKALKNPGQVYPFSGEATLPEMEVLGDPVRFDAVQVNGEFLCTGDGRVSVRADVTSQVHTRCSRCLEPVDMRQDTEVDALFDKAPDPDDPDLYSFEGYAIELEDAVQEALLLRLPLQFLCRPDCKGLCPHCGTNLNRQTCTCQEGNVVTGPFSALKSIVLNDEEV